MKAISLEGKRSKQVINGEFLGLAQRTGLMLIYDDASSTRIAIVKMYDALRDDRVEAYAQDVFLFNLSRTLRNVSYSSKTSAANGPYSMSMKGVCAL
jgi:hypothetical protein